MSDSPTGFFVGKARGLSPLLSLGWAGLMAAVCLTVALPAAAHGDEDEAKSSRVPVPHHVVEKGDKCVEEEGYMRRNHMTLLKHHRDETMHKGIRTTKYSLKNCVECHASKENNSVIGTKENFCQGCHSYAAVKLDCFECHSSKPKVQAVKEPKVDTPSPQSEAKDKQSSFSGKAYRQINGKLASLNTGEVVK